MYVCVQFEDIGERCYLVMRGLEAEKQIDSINPKDMAPAKLRLPTGSDDGGKRLKSMINNRRSN